MRTIPKAALFLTMTASVFADAETDTMMEKIRAENEVPALGGIAIVDGEVKTIGVAGLRKFKGKEKVTTEDKWHIGSCTKSMTATLAATFVEEGKLKWESSIGEVFGRKMKMRDEYRNVTLKMLVTHRSGIPGSAPTATLVKAALSSGRRDIERRRKGFAEALLKMKPDFEPGTKHAYSNSGFVVAGVMLEQVSGKSWEELMQERIFKPLQMDSAGFGGAASKRKEDQPWGHTSKTKPVAPGPGDDNPDVIGPAGTVHCSLTDLARYVKMHMDYEVGPVLKKAKTFEFLQTVAEGNDDYACGWVVTKREWAKGPALWHNGSNTMNYCLIWFAPKRKFAAIAVTNVGPESGRGPCEAVVGKFLEKFLAEGGAGAAPGEKEVGPDSKLSPFGALRWNGDDPVVKVDGKWFKLVSLAGIDAGKMVAFCKSHHGDKWQRRFGEDLVEVLVGMGHKPTRTVDLVVQALDSTDPKTLKGVTMTEENRGAIRDARTDSE